MDTTLSLDATNGCIAAFGIAINAGLAAGALPTVFTQTRAAMPIDGNLIDCTLAHATGFVGNVELELNLRFEEEALVSAGMTLTPPRFRKLFGDEFYNSVDDRYRYHQRWLKSQGIPDSSVPFPWGDAGVAKDKSENVYLYVLYRKVARPPRDAK